MNLSKHEQLLLNVAQKFAHKDEKVTFRTYLGSLIAHVAGVEEDIQEIENVFKKISANRNVVLKTVNCPTCDSEVIMEYQDCPFCTHSLFDEDLTTPQVEVKAEPVKEVVKETKTTKATPKETVKAETAKATPATKTKEAPAKATETKKEVTAPAKTTATKEVKEEVKSTPTKTTKSTPAKETKKEVKEDPKRGKDIFVEAEEKAKAKAEEAQGEEEAEEGGLVIPTADEIKVMPREELMAIYKEITGSEDFAEILNYGGFTILTEAKILKLADKAFRAEVSRVLKETEATIEKYNADLEAQSVEEVIEEVETPEDHVEEITEEEVVEEDSLDNESTLDINLDDVNEDDLFDGDMDDAPEDDEFNFDEE